ncbi:hypothetical protein ACTZGP_17615 [Pseudomonas putida]|uniref:hypothetical protein n=1 Tax=Pseudomonas putida TaxID=303 RepID=UPI003FD2ECE3
MSTSLNLVIYHRNGDDLIEEDLRTARCEEIPPSMLNAIREKFPTQKCKIYYDSTKEDFFEIDHFARTDIPKIIIVLRSLFDDLIKHEHDLRNLGVDTTSPRLKGSDLTLFNIPPSQNELDPTSVAIGRFRILISIIDIFSEMQTKYANEPDAVLKLG